MLFLTFQSLCNPGSSFPQILPLIDMEDPESMERFVDVYLVSPLYDKDLGKVISSKVALSDEHIQYFVYQTLCALKYMHRCVQMAIM